MFEIKCIKCGETVTFENGVNDEGKISVRGQIESLYNSEVYIECNCGNSIEIEK